MGSKRGRRAGRCSLPAPAGAAVLALGLTLAAGCASPLSAVRDGENRVFEHRELGYRIAHPGPRERAARWAPMKLEGVDLGFRGPDGALVSLIHECRETAAPPQILAQNLLIGLEDRVIRESSPVEHRGDPGWMLVFDAAEDGVPVRIKTVTLRAGTCVYDWVLVASGAFAGPEEVFDRWWSSFVRPEQSELARAEGAPLPGKGR